MIGRVYLERGQPVTVRARWGKGGGPRNVLIERESGLLVVRSFRGLRVADRLSVAPAGQPKEGPVTCAS